MKKFLLVLGFILYTLYSTLYTHAPQTHATSVTPFAPFSEEGNPPEDYFFSEIFPLLSFIPAKNFQIYENADRSRKYDLYDLCNYGDNRDYDCSNDDQACDGGNAAICHIDRTSFVYTGHSSPNDSCSSKIIDANHPAGTEGSCNYKQNPKIVKELKGTDFSVGLTYPKIQSGAGAYVNIGNDKNPITYGSLYLSNQQCEIVVKKLLVVRRAAQTKTTLRETGEWPLGWVDWGYKTPNGKTLLDINKEIPDDIASHLNELVEGIDDYFLTAANMDQVSDVSGAKKLICDAYNNYVSLTDQPEWLTDLSQSPLYPPSFRQGYTRVSICVWGFCCLTYRCRVDLLGNNRGLYYDPIISQAYNAAIDDLLMKYPLKEGIKIFVKLVTENPLIRYLSSASPAAIPSAIKEKLDIMLKGTCADYAPWKNWLGFATYVDYMNGSPLDPAKKCPGYTLMPELEKQTAAAYSPLGGSFILSMLWLTPADDLAQVKYHHITVPDPMAQSIKSIQQYAYDTRYDLGTLKGIEDYNNSLSNSIASDKDNFYGGESSFPQNAKSNISTLYSCNDPMYSAHKPTSIEDYANGVRNGCFEEPSVPEGKCDGQLFAKLIENSGYTESSAKGKNYFDTNIKTRLTAELMNTYAAAEKETGIPCEILAGIHFVEADNNPDGSLVSGRKLGTPEPDAGGKVFKSLLETATYAGEHLKGKVGGNMGDATTAITALSRYNGGGNSNCQAGYPYSIPYSGCPRTFEGEDDPYPTSFLDNKHDSMYLLYCADHTACVPAIFERPGSFTVALNVYNSMTKDGYKNTDLPKTQKPSTPDTSSPGTKTGSTGFFPRSCGPESLSTALGCIPYTKDAFVGALLTFLAGLAGAVALIVMLISTIQIMISAGDPKKLQAAKELFISAVIGLLFLIFSVSLLRIIAGDIIKLPGF